MPPPLPERYQLEVRLGRDGDIEEWLATDMRLDRPVLVRVLGPDASPRRRAQFLQQVRAASAVSHPHVQQIYEADQLADGAFTAGEWTGGLDLAGRVEAGETIDPAEFLPNAAGLASGLAALHQTGVIHGAINLGAISYTVAHPAKLGRFGRKVTAPSALGDVADLSTALEHALTGFVPGGPPPSQLIDGLSADIDRALALGRSGRLTARQLAEALTAAPTPLPPPAEGPATSVRGLGLAAALVGLAIALVVLGRVLAAPDSPAVFPLNSTTTAPPPATTAATSTSPATTAAGTEPLSIVGAATFDPFGEGGENDDRINLVVDGDPSTSWRTERYLDPLPLLKPGVGLTVELTGTPSVIEVVGMTAGTSFRLAWSVDRPSDPEQWEAVATARSAEGPVELRLPPRRGGYWLIWFTDLPRAEDGYLTRVAEIRFTP